MGQTGIFDVFQAAIGASGAVLDELDKQNRLKAEVELQSAKTQAAEQFNQYLIDLQYRNDFENFHADWENKSKQIYNRVTQGLSSPFARRLYDMQYQELSAAQKVKVAGFQRAKLAEFNTVNTFNNITDIIESAGYIEKQDEDGRTISISEQKAADAQKALLTLYQYDGRSYENLNSDLQKVGKQLLLHDMKQRALSALNDGTDIEKVLDDIRADSSQLTLLNNQTVYSEELKGKVREQALEYYKEKIYYKQEKNQNDITQQYNNLLKVSVLQNYEAAVPLAKKLLGGINALITKDKTALSRPFSESKTKELVDFLSMQDKYLKKGGRSSFYGFLSKLDINGLSEVIIEQLKNGYPALDDNGNPTGAKKYYSPMQIVDHYNKEIIPEMAEALGVSETEMRYKFAGLKDAVSAKLFDDKHCPQEIKIFLKHSNQDIENIVRARMGKKTDTPEGEIAISSLQAGFYLDITTKLLGAGFIDEKTNMWSLEAVKKARDAYIREHLLGEFSAVKEGVETEAAGPVQRHLFDEDNKQAKEAGAALKALGSSETKDTYGRPIETEQTRALKASLTNYVWNDIKERDGITLEAAQKKYSLFIDSKNSVAHLTDNTSGRRIDGIVAEDDGRIIFTEVKKDAAGVVHREHLKSGRQVAHERKQQEKERNAFEYEMSYFDDVSAGEKGSFKKASDEFMRYAEAVPHEQQNLFAKIKRAVVVKARGKKMSVSEMEAQVIKEYEEERQKDLKEKR